MIYYYKFNFFLSFFKKMSITLDIFPSEWNLPPIKNWEKYSIFNIKRIIEKTEIVPGSGCLEFTGKSLYISKIINGKRKKIHIRYLIYALFIEEPPINCIVEQICRHVSICLHPEHLKLVHK